MESADVVPHRGERKMQGIMARDHSNMMIFIGIDLPA
jgi:hypothetical protein